MGYPVPEPLPDVDTGPLQPYGAALPVSIKVSERMGVRPKTPPPIRMPKDAEEKLRRAIDEDGDNPDINMLLAFELRKLRWLEAKLGRQKSRAVLGCLGIGMVALGLAIAFGFRFGR